MDRWVNRVALVTGASSGIGAGLCEDLVRSGMKVVGAARRVDRIEALANSLKGEKGELLAVKCDLTKDEDVYALFKKIKTTYGGVDICINNAGVITPNSILDGTPEEWRKMINVNVIALCLCTRLSVESMKERGVDDGHIVNIGSIVGHFVWPIPASHFYGGTKFAVRAITEGVRQELRKDNSHIRVSSISPSIVKTELMNHGFGDPAITEKLCEVNTFLDTKNIVDTVHHMIEAPAHVEINDIIIDSAGPLVM